MPVICSDRGPVNLTTLSLALASLMLLAVFLTSNSGRVVRSGFNLSVAQATTGVTTSTGTTPAAAENVFGIWDDVLSLKVIPLGALAIGVAAIFAGIRAGSGGLIGGGVVGILVAILTVALPAIVSESAGASFDLIGSNTGKLSPFTPFTPVFYSVVRYVRRVR